jgi:hypothetical protein
MDMGANIDLTAPSLFGNDAAEDEDEDVFFSYALERPELQPFLDHGRKLCIVRAYKGEGKSALIRLAKQQLLGEAFIVVATKASQISPSDISTTDTDPWVRAWKRALLQRVAQEVGTTIGMAWGDDGMSLVEEAEKAGFKKRSIVSAIVERIKAALPVEKALPTAADPSKLVQRWASGKGELWILVDDTDENFVNDKVWKAKVASMFLAARDIIGMIPEARLRLTIRPNTWATIAREFEALSKVEQYNIDLRWDEASLVDMLGARIRGYIQRTNQWDEVDKTKRQAADLIGLAFESPVEWSHRRKPMHVPLITLARRRPRWLVELCREAGKAAKRQQHDRAKLADVTQCLEEFGKRRISDTVAEFSPQCPQIAELIAAFSRQQEEYSTDELLKTIDRRILPHLTPVIAGVAGTPRAVEVAAFLFQIGFLSARRTLDADGHYEHISFSDQPDLLRTRTNLDDGVRWEIHPVFRQALQLRDAAGRSLRPAPRDGRGR